MGSALPTDEHQEPRARLVGRVSALRAALGEARSTGDSALLVAVHMEAHRLHGTAGSLGYDLVGVHAAVLEDILSEVLRTHAEVDSDGWRQLTDAALRMADALREAPRLLSAPPFPTRPIVLIVDDDPTLLEHVAGQASTSLDVLRACQSAQALELARNVRLACAVIDVHLGAPFHGLELAKALRAQTGSEQVPIVFMSGDSLVDTQIAGLHAGGAVFLSKPIAPGAVVDAVRRVTEIETKARPCVLLLDDDDDFCAAVQRVLRTAGLDVCAIQHEGDLLEALSTENPALLLLDVGLNGASGLDICRMLRANQRWAGLDVVLMTAESSVERRIAGFRAGASDYVSKPIIAEELIARVMARIERHTLREERTTRDSLTGLMLRGQFSDAFERALKLAQRSHTPLSLCLLDVDHFKSVNDRYGHVAGDRVLATLGELLQRRFRTEDLRCRWGGEEMVLTLLGSPNVEAKLALEKLLAEFMATTFDDGGRPAFGASFSAGVASYPDDGHALDALVAVADERMYSAKRQGRARVIGTGHAASLATGALRR